MFGICVAVKPTTSNSSRPRYTRLKLWKSRPAAPAINTRVRCMHRAYAATQDGGPSEWPDRVTRFSLIGQGIEFGENLGSGVVFNVPTITRHTRRVDQHCVPWRV